ncbi:ALP1-like protein, partial [Tanacetum coccineum]
MEQMKLMFRLTMECDAICISELRMDRDTFNKPELITEDCQDERWKCFQACLGALDGTLVKVTPPSGEKPRYRTRKGCISTNILGVCCPNMQFIYVLPGWEGSSHDSHVLYDPISMPQGLRFLSHDPQESVLNDDDNDDEEEEEMENKDESEDMEYVTNISPSDEWMMFRNTLSK